MAIEGKEKLTNEEVDCLIKLLPAWYDNLLSHGPRGCPSIHNVVSQKTAWKGCESRTLKNITTLGYPENPKVVGEYRGGSNRFSEVPMKYLSLKY